MGFWETVKKVVDEADIVIEVLDARFPEKSRNQELERLVWNSGKELVLLLNKADLIGKKAAARQSRALGRNCIFISAAKRNGTAMLRRKIGELAAGRPVKVAVAGYPNVGKSSVINALGRKKAARTSPRAGFTKGTQLVRMSRNIMLIDTPGVIPVDEKDEALMVMLGSKNPEQLNDLEATGAEIAGALLKADAPGLCSFYCIAGTEDEEELLERIALSRGRLLRGGRPDLNAAARILINDLQKGKLRFST